MPGMNFFRRWFGPTSRAHHEFELDVVRGIALLLAAGWHFHTVTTDNLLVAALLWPGSTFGWVGVDLFFVLSGFLVGRLIFEEYRDRHDVDIRRFYLRRIFRLWPSLYVFLLAMILGSGREFSGFAPQIGLHVQNYVPASLAGHLWSLAVEEHFYLLFALLMILLIRGKASQRSVFVVCFIVLATAPLLRVAGWMQGLSPITLQWQTQFRMDALAAGVLLAACSVFRPVMFAAILRFRALWAGLVLLGLGFLVVVHKDSGLGTTLGYTVSYMSSACFLLAIHRWDGICRIRPLLTPVALLAPISYAFYIWHITAGEVVRRVWVKLGLDPMQALILVPKYALSLVVAVAVTLLIEKPMMRLRDRLVRPRRPAGRAAPVPATN